jgi:hypothetical protein
MKGKKLGLGIVLLLAAAFTAYAQQYDSEFDFRICSTDGNKAAEIISYTKFFYPRRYSSQRGVLPRGLYRF